MRHRGGEHVTEAVADAVALLRTVADRDWDGVKAGRLDWSCRATAEHMAGDLITYAGQLAGRAPSGYVPFEITLDEGTGNDGLLDVLETTGALLTAVLYRRGVPAVDADAAPTVHM